MDFAEVLPDPARRDAERRWNVLRICSCVRKPHRDATTDGGTPVVSSIRRAHETRSSSIAAAGVAAHIISAGRRHIPRCSHCNGLRTQDPSRCRVFRGRSWILAPRLAFLLRIQKCAEQQCMSFSRHPPDAPAGGLLMAPPSRGTRKFFGLSRHKRPPPREAGPLHLFHGAEEFSCPCYPAARREAGVQRSAATQASKGEKT